MEAAAAASSPACGGGGGGGGCGWTAPATAAVVTTPPADPAAAAAASTALAKSLVVRVLAKWLVCVHVPAARKQLAAAACAAVSGEEEDVEQEDAASAATTWTIKVEASGSGALILAAVEVRPTDTVGDTKRRIHELWEAQHQLQHQRLQQTTTTTATTATQPPDHFSLFVEHGGPELEVHALSLRGCKVRDGSTLVVLAKNARAVLNAFFDATGGRKAWTKHVHWASPQPLHEWQGVIASQATDSVSGLDLKRGNLTGRLIPQLAQLHALTTLDLSQNKLTGPLPTELCSLGSLQRLQLCENRLSGQLPTELGNLAKLEVLELNHNGFQGPLPSELGNLSVLTHLYLWSNPLSGPIPSQLKNLRHSLSLVDLSETNLESQPYLTDNGSCRHWLDKL